MKIALTTSASSLEALLDSRFGRAPGFLIYDTETKAHEFVDNRQNLNAAQGAGIQAAQNLVATGAECVITGQCGPKALRVLSSAGIKIYHSDAFTLSECIEQFRAGKLTEIQNTTVAGERR